MLMSGNLKISRHSNELNLPFEASFLNMYFSRYCIYIRRTLFTYLAYLKDRKPFKYAIFKPMFQIWKMCTSQDISPEIFNYLWFVPLISLTYFLCSFFTNRVHYYIITYGESINITGFSLAGARYIDYFLIYKEKNNSSFMVFLAGEIVACSIYSYFVTNNRVCIYV